MKKFVQIPSILFSKEQTTNLKLQEQPYLILIPKSIFAKYGINSEEITFDLTLENNRIMLLGPSARQAPEANQSFGVTDT